MNRLRPLLVVGAIIATAVVSAASGQSVQPVLRHPNPLASQIVVDYASPIPARGGGFAWLVPLYPGVIKASVIDLRYLQYEKQDDLGGFIPAPTGWLALGTGGKFMGNTVVGKGGPSEIVLYSKNALGGNRVNSYTPLHGLPRGKVGSATNCVRCGSAIIFQPPPGLFTNPGGGTGPNGCFGGCPKPPNPNQHGRKHRNHGKGNGNGNGNPNHGHGGKGSPGDCGTPGLSIVSDLPNCRIYVVNRAPGDSTLEHDVIKNTSKSRYVLYFKATGEQNRLWNDLQMGVWLDGQPVPDALPALTEWTHDYVKLATLAPGQSIHLNIELALPQFAGNSDQHLAAVVSFNWRAVATHGH